eukprot:COSAG01_NODE_54356_length_332_cov_1.334764_1_plen_44_part_10
MAPLTNTAACLLQERVERFAELLNMRVGASCMADYGFVNALLVP